MEILIQKQILIRCLLRDWNPFFVVDFQQDMITSLSGREGGGGGREGEGHVWV